MFKLKKPKIFEIKGLWCVHSYYTLCPYAPDGSGRILAAGVDLKTRIACVLILSGNGQVLDKFGAVPVIESFWHTGLWQSWSPDGQYVYYQGGTLKNPLVIKRRFSDGHESTMTGDMEGLPPSGESGLSCLHGMLYAAGYGTGKYDESVSPVAFGARDKHGIFKIDFEKKASELMLSTETLIERIPDKEILEKHERELQARLGEEHCLTLMTYCIRWNKEGSRFLFYLGNHCVVSERKEPRLGYVFTSDKDMNDINLAVNLSFEQWGVHWGWHPDGEHLIGYGPEPGHSGNVCLAQVHHTGTGYKKILDHASGGHPSISPSEHNLLLTDESTIPGKVLLIDIETQNVIETIQLPRVNGHVEPSGRNEFRVCHHPVFNQDGSKILMNSIQGDLAQLVEIEIDQ